MFEKLNPVLMTLDELETELHELKLVCDNHTSLIVSRLEREIRQFRRQVNDMTVTVASM